VQQIYIYPLYSSAPCRWLQ